MRFRYFRIIQRKLHVGVGCLNCKLVAVQLWLNNKYIVGYQIEGFKMNLIYYDLYKAKRLEKFVTGMPSSFLHIFNLLISLQLLE